MSGGDDGHVPRSLGGSRRVTFDDVTLENGKRSTRAFLKLDDIGPKAPKNGRMVAQGRAAPPKNGRHEGLNGSTLAAAGSNNNGTPPLNGAAAAYAEHFAAAGTGNMSGSAGNGKDKASTRVLDVRERLPPNTQANTKSNNIAPNPTSKSINSTPKATAPPHKANTPNNPVVP